MYTFDSNSNWFTRSQKSLPEVVVFYTCFSYPRDCVCLTHVLSEGFSMKCVILTDMTHSFLVWVVSIHFVISFLQENHCFWTTYTTCSLVFWNPNSFGTCFVHPSLSRLFFRSTRICLLKVRRTGFNPFRIQSFTFAASDAISNHSSGVVITTRIRIIVIQTPLLMTVI